MLTSLSVEEILLPRLMNISYGDNYSQNIISRELLVAFFSYNKVGLVSLFKVISIFTKPSGKI